jgi:hypothetical protein
LGINPWFRFYLLSRGMGVYLERQTLRNFADVPRNLCAEPEHHKLRAKQA